MHFFEIQRQGLPISVSKKLSEKRSGRTEFWWRTGRVSGGYAFRTKLPVNHCGEDVLAQLRVMKYYGGCAIIPSGAYHQEAPTTVPHRNVDAPRVLPL